MRISATFATILFFFSSLSAQDSLEYLWNLNVPYHDEMSARSFDSGRSTYVHSFEKSWMCTMTSISDNPNQKKYEWFGRVSDSMQVRPLYKYAVQGTFNHKISGEYSNIVLHIQQRSDNVKLILNGTQIRPDTAQLVGKYIQITNFVNDGPNHLMIELSKITESWNLMDLLKCVYIIYIPPLHTNSLVVKGDASARASLYGLSAQGKTGLQIYERITNYEKTGNKAYHVRRSLYSINPMDTFNYISWYANPAWFDRKRHPFSLNEYSFSSSSLSSSHNRVSTIYVPDAQKWHGEHPELYVYVQELLDENSKHIETLSIKTGFRDVLSIPKLFVGNRVKQKEGLLFNQRKMLIKGIYYRPSILDDISKIEEELIRIKKENFNSIYVKAKEINSEVLGICDRMGIYVMIDATLHELRDGNKQMDAEKILRQLYHEYINHPSLILWVFKDVGLASSTYDVAFKKFMGYTANVPAVIVAPDARRLPRIAGRNMLVGVEDQNEEDIFGGLEAYEGYPILVFGGLGSGAKSKVREFVDRMRAGYPPGFHGFVIGGIESIETLETEQLAPILADVEMDWISNTSFSFYLKNHYQITNLSSLEFRAELFQDNQKVAEDVIAGVNVAPGQSELYNLSLNHSLRPGSVYQLKIASYTKESSVWAPEGHKTAEAIFWLQKDPDGPIRRIELSR